MFRATRNRFFRIIAVFLASAQPICAHAMGSESPPSKNELTFAIGPSYQQLTERLLFGERYAGFGAGGHVRLEIDKEPYRHTISIWGGYGRLYDPDDYGAMNVKAGMSYALVRRCYTSSDSRWTWFVGPQFAAKYSIQMFESLDDSHGYWLTRYDVAVNNGLNYTLSDRMKFFGLASIPILGVMSRPEYRRNYNTDRPNIGYIVDLLHSNSAVSSFNDYFQALVEIGMRIQLSEQWSEAILYQFDYTYTTTPKRRKTLDQSVLLSIGARF